MNRQHPGFQSGALPLELPHQERGARGGSRTHTLSDRSLEPACLPFHHPRTESRRAAIGSAPNTIELSKSERPKSKKPPGPFGAEGFMELDLGSQLHVAPGGKKPR